MRCYECGKGTLRKKLVEYVQYGIPIGKFDAQVCSACDEVFYAAEAVQQIEKVMKAKGIHGLGAKTKIGTSGTALDVKLPKSLVDFMKLQKGQQVTIEPMGKDRFQVVVEK